MSLANIISRCTVALANAAGKLQSLQIRLLADEVKDDVEHLEPYGFTSCPHGGAEGVAVFPGGDRSHGVVVVIADRRFRLQNLKNGEVALYTDEGDKLHFQRGRKLLIETGSLEIKAANSVSIDAPSLTHNGKNIGNTHTHGGVESGPSNTSVPN